MLFVLDMLLMLLHQEVVRVVASVHVMGVNESPVVAHRVALVRLLPAVHELLGGWSLIIGAQLHRMLRVLREECVPCLFHSLAFSKGETTSGFLLRKLLN